MNFTAIIYQVGNKENLTITEDSVIRYGINALYIEKETLVEVKDNGGSVTPLDNLRPEKLELRDVILYLKSGTELHDNTLQKIEETFNSIIEPRIGAIYSDFILKNRMCTTDIYLRAYERQNWMQVALETPVLAVRRDPEVPITLNPDINYFAQLNQSLPIIKITEHLVTLHG